MRQSSAQQKIAAKTVVNEKEQSIEMTLANMGALMSPPMDRIARGERPATVRRLMLRVGERGTPIPSAR